VAERTALESQIPYVRLLDATGGSVKTFEKLGHTYLPQNAAGDLSTRLLQTVPVVSAVMGSVAGLPAVQACLCHFNLMIRNTSQVFVAGPPVVKAAHGTDIAKEDLGNEDIQLASGTINNLAESEEHAFELIRSFLSYMPSNVYELPVKVESNDDPGRREEELLSIIPRDRRKIYDPMKLLRLVLDTDSIFEISPSYGRSRMTALARINGYPVGVMSNNPKFLGGSMDSAAGDKVIRFIELCETFHLPVVYFADEPGFMVGLAAEKQGIVRAGARVVAVVSSSRVPMITFITRQLFGVAGGLHHRAGGMYRRYSWPSGSWGSMHIEGGAMAAYRRVIEAADDPEAKKAEIEEQLYTLDSPFRTAHTFGVEGIIDPRDTRPLLAEFVEDAQAALKAQLGPRTGIGYRP
jgi:acetyl-CoA carboxylase carboxyltransferase component